ncbi:hypothetical protein [Haloarcula sp. CBA1127]|uniref:hypothetical protein n=1 Tax=Haloarcula sp. CBA1127 TaxID=1765055 RepID=UPI000A9794C2|nr:hypothetical protein [Haloarcula sp. CBA1127]
MLFSDQDVESESTEKVLEKFVDFVTKTDEEIAEEGREKKKQSTELKLYTAASNGFEIGQLHNTIQELVASDSLNQAPQQFFEKHTFSIEPVNDEASLLVITTPKYSRDDEFLLIEGDDYLKAVTVVRKTIAEDTIERLIQYIPSLDRIFLSSENLQEIVKEYKKRDLSGFTAKYEPFFKDEYISVQVHGGSDDHLRKVEEDFDARPKRVVFSQRNSPAEAVKGTVSQHGYASIPRVREGSGDVGIETIENIIETTQQKDQENFAVPHRPERLTPGDRYFLTQLTLDESGDENETDGGIPEALRDADQGSVLDGLTICVFREELRDEDYPDDDAVAQSLKEDILEYKQRYRYSLIGNNQYLVYDGDRGQSFEVIVSEKDLKVYTRGNTTQEGLRDFYQIIDDEFNSSYSIDKTAKKMRA